MNKITVTFLGSASGQSDVLEPVSFIIEYMGTRLLVETGPNVNQLLQQQKLRVSDFAAVFVTHSHADHSLGFPYLAFFKHMDRLELGDKVSSHLTLYASEIVVKGLMDAIGFCYPPGKFPTYEFRNRVLIDNHTERLNEDISFSAFTVDHTVETFGLAFDFSNGKKIVYSSDTILSDKVVSRAGECDLLIHEAMLPSDAIQLRNLAKHSTINDAAIAARDSRARRLAICHMIPSLYSKRQPVINEIRRVYNGDVVFPDKHEKIVV